MMIRILGAVDLISAILFFLSRATDILSEKIVWLIGAYLIIKGVLFVFSKDIASALDILCGIVILLSLAISIHSVIILMVYIYLIQKAVFSFFH